MSADDQAFLDILSSVPNDIKRYSGDVADYVDKHLEKVSNVLRDALSSSEWLPAAARPQRPPPPSPKLSHSVPVSTLSQIYNWASRNKVLTTVVVIATGGVVYYALKGRSGRKKRRAKRAGNGARLEVVVVAGSPSEPITRSISLDLERRGFIVYVVCNTIEEETIVQNEARTDIKPLMIDIVDSESTQASIERLTAHLQSPHAAFQGARLHHLQFRSLILIPSQTYPSAPLSTLSPASISDLLNTRLLTPILTLKAFLPLFHSAPLSHPHHHATQKPQPKPSVLLLTPNIISSLSPAFHLPESSIVAALTSSINVLSAELSPLDIHVTHLQLGTFDLSAFTPHQNWHHSTVQSQRAETLKWDESSREAYAKNFVALSSGRGCGSTGVGRGSSLRELNNAVFDAMVKGKGGIVRVGAGSGIYGFVGRWVPRGLVGWMMGMRNVGGEEREVEFGRLIKGSETVSRSTSPESSSSGVKVYDLGLSAGESEEFTSVYREMGDEDL